jgi:sigma-B regulation protein RsbU (phosphoserine phosphatase)
VVFYTDGIVEAMSPDEELFGFERLEDAVRGSTDLSAQELLDKILDQVNTFAAGADQHDDITVIIIKIAA